MLLVTVRWEADEDSEVWLVQKIDDELDEVSEVDYEEVSEVGEADEWRQAEWGLWSPSSWWVMMMSWIRLVRWESQCCRESETDEWR